MLPISDRDLNRRSFPVVNIGIIIVCAIVFFYELAAANCDCFFYQFGMIPYEFAHGTSLKYICPDVFSGGSLLYDQTPSILLLPTCEDISSPIPTWATIFTSMFIHGGWFHFLGNMLFLWVFGDNIEDRFGHVKYLLFYLASGVAAGTLQIAVDTNSAVPTIGASGAIAGVLGAYLLFYPFSRIDTFFFFIIAKVPAVFLLGFWFLLQFASGVDSLGPSAQGSGGVAYWAHIGGFLMGLLVAVLYKLGHNEPLWPKQQQAELRDWIDKLG